jgi:hypothetical protein
MITVFVSFEWMMLNIIEASYCKSTLRKSARSSTSTEPFSDAVAIGRDKDERELLYRAFHYFHYILLLSRSLMAPTVDVELLGCDDVIACVLNSNLRKECGQGTDRL